MTDIKLLVILLLVMVIFLLGGCVIVLLVLFPTFAVPVGTAVAVMALVVAVVGLAMTRT
jgi:hypothetical protein